MKKNLEEEEGEEEGKIVGGGDAVGKAKGR